MTPTKEADITAGMARLEEKIDGIKDDVSDINKKLYGNGHPGIIVDQVKQDEQINKLMQIAIKNEGAIAKLSELSAPSWLTRNWIKIVLLTILVIVIVHSIIPENYTLWQLISLIK